MAKPFFDVFPTLKLDGRMKELMDEVEVDKVSTTRKQDFIRIYLSSNRLIEKADVWKAEKEKPPADIIARFPNPALPLFS